MKSRFFFLNMSFSFYILLFFCCLTSHTLRNPLHDRTRSSTLLFRIYRVSVVDTEHRDCAFVAWRKFESLWHWPGFAVTWKKKVVACEFMLETHLVTENPLNKINDAIRSRLARFLPWNLASVTENSWFSVFVLPTLNWPWSANFQISLRFTWNLYYPVTL